MKNQRGFTLLELLIAITLLAAITAILTAGFQLSLRSWEAGQERMEGHYDLTEGMALIAGQLKGAREVNFVNEKNEKTLAFHGEAKKLLFVANAPRLKALTDADGFYLQRLSFDAEKEALLFSEALFDPHTPAGEVKWTDIPMGEGTIKEFKFEYLYREGTGGDLKDVWREKSVDEKDLDKIPLAVRLSLVMEESNDPFVWPPLTVRIEPGGAVAPEEKK